MIWAHFFCHKNYLCTFFVAKKFAHTFFVAKTICAFFLLQERFRPESFCALKVAIRKDQTFWASGLGHGVEHLLVPRLPREGLFGTHKVRIWHHIFHLLRVEMVMATLPLVVLDVEVIVVSGTQSDSIQYLNFAKKWFIQYSIQYCFALDSIQNIIQFKKNLLI